MKPLLNPVGVMKEIFFIDPGADIAIVRLQDSPSHTVFFLLVRSLFLATGRFCFIGISPDYI